MARPRVKELTERELEVMHAFWKLGETTVADVRDDLIGSGRELAYTTVATLVRILCDKGFLEQTSPDRPFRFKSVRTFEDVSRSMLGDMLDRVFGGSREQLMLRLMEQQKLTVRERRAIEQILRESGQ
jgi:predicted transcriptional regulator